MCSECGELSEPNCSFCGETCWGKCSDPDACPSCWVHNNDRYGMWCELMSGDEGRELDECLETGCRCGCHDEMYADMGIRFEHGVRKDEEVHGPPFLRKGVFPFLKVPGEIRDRIYGFAFLQDGDRRLGSYGSGNHRGTIHTALLGTCRQIYKEASKLPLSLNTLNFVTGLHALYFFGFHLSPTQKELLTSVHIELDWREFHELSWNRLLLQLPKIPLTHFGLTIKGTCTKEMFLGHSCFTNRLKSSLKGLKSFELNLGSGTITKQVKEDIQEQMREALIKGYKSTKTAKITKKRSATIYGDDEKPAKKAKVKYQARLVVSPTFRRLGMRSQKSEWQAAEAARGLEKQSLLGQYEQLRQYAMSIDHDAAPVKIRLEDARKAVEAFDVEKFGQLMQAIRQTLEERYDQIATARNSLPPFVKTISASAPLDVLSSQESDEDSDEESSDSTGTSISSQLSL